VAAEAQVLLEQEQRVVQDHIVHFQDHLLLMRVAAAVQQTQAQRVLAVSVVAVMAVRRVA
jgi:hypothetical protein